MALLAVVMLTGCGVGQNATTGQESSGQTDEKAEKSPANKEASDAAEVSEASEASDAAEVADNSEKNDAQTADGTETIEGSVDGVEYILTIHDDAKADLFVKSRYTDTHASTDEYTGTVSEIDGGYRFDYQDSADEEWKFTYELKVSNGMITQIEQPDDKVSGIVGTYKGDDETLGVLDLKIEPSGSAQMRTGSGSILKGSIMDIDGRWDLMVSDEDSTINVDWYVDFDGKKFTHEEYSFARYAEYVGVWDCFGDMGPLQISFIDGGDASASMKIDGKQVLFNGSYYVDFELHKITGAYLTSEEGYTLDLTLEMVDGTYNYSGTFGKPLSAG